MNQDQGHVRSGAPDEALRVGPWAIYAHVELRSQQRGCGLREPDLRAGDVWVRIVVEIDFEDDFDGLDGLRGELTTQWQDGLKPAIKAAKRMRGMLLAWSEYDETNDKYEEALESLQPERFDALIDAAVERFRLTSQQALGL